MRLQKTHQVPSKSTVPAYEMKIGLVPDVGGKKEGGGATRVGEIPPSTFAFRFKGTHAFSVSVSAHQRPVAICQNPIKPGSRENSISGAGTISTTTHTHR